MVLLARLVPSWADAPMIVKPETLLRWHWLGFRLFWRRKARSRSRQPRISRAVVELFFRQVFVLPFLEHGCRRVVHTAATYHPTRAWVTQKPRSATFEKQPRFLIRDNDDYRS